MRGVRELHRALRWVRSRFVQGGLILLYHRVAVDPLDPFALCVKPDHFRAHMAALRAWGHPMALADLASAARRGTLPPRSVAVTFDDGYADTLYHALPVLTEYEIPATVFVTTGNPGQPFWWDRLGRQIMGAPELPPQLELVVEGQPYQWTVDGASHRQRLTLQRQLHLLSRRLPAEPRAALVQQLEAWSGAEMPADLRALTTAEIEELAAVDPIDLGAHTVHHPALAARPLREQLQELQQSRMALEALLGRAVTTMSYPFGMPGRDYDDRTVQLVRQAGYTLACTVNMDVVEAATDSLQLPRHWVFDGSGEQLLRKLRRWLQ